MSNDAPPDDGSPPERKAYSATLPDPAEFKGELSGPAKTFVENVRAELEEECWNGTGGTDLVYRFSDAVDELVRFVVDATTERFSRRYARAHQRCAVIAQGGYGRREMNPWSDVDLLIVYPGRVSPYVETVAERLIQTFFDAQLQCGWAVRTQRDCVDQAARDLTIKTSLLDGRPIAGSRTLQTSFIDGVREVLAAKSIDAFVEQKIAETGRRHAAQGGSVFMLEPDIKEGQGGLRDIHTLMWIARMKREITTLGELAKAEIASEGEQAELIAAHDFLLRVRNAVHFLKRGKQDKLSFDEQETIAEKFGYEATDTHSGVDQFMREYYTNAAIVHRTTGDILGRLTAPPEPKGIINRLGSRKVRDGVSVVGGQLVVDDEHFAEDPINLLRVFHDAQRNEVSLSSRTQENVRKSCKRLTLKVVRTEEAIDVFMQILRWSGGVYATLGEMNRLGVLGKLIPEFGRLFCMVQHDFFHVYTVDEHSLIGIRELENLRQGAFESDSPLLTQVMRECDRPEILFLGMMFHDLGKGYGGDHDERGARMVKTIGRRLGLHLDDRRALEFLVRHHLLMSMLAQTRDIDDAELVAGFVKDVGTLDNLRYLYLLTFADMKAVGPKVWNGWRDHLLSELYLRAVDVFETGTVTEANLAARVKRVRGRILARAVAEGADGAAVESFLMSLPPSYLVSGTETRILDHWRLFDSLGTGVFRAEIAHFTERGFSELTVCTRDTEGLFAGLTGVLSARGLNVVGAKIVTSTAGVVIDSFRIDHAHSALDLEEEGVWESLQHEIEHVLADELDVGEMVEEARRARPLATSARRLRKRVMTRVSIDNDVSRQYTVLDVYGGDRTGLLFDLARAIYELGLTIHLAKINTHVHQVLDVFYVTGPDAKKLRSAKDEQRVIDKLMAQIVEPEEETAHAS